MGARTAALVCATLAGTTVSAQQAAPAAGADQSGQSGEASGDFAARFASNCAACHGAQGRSSIPTTPVLAGQHAFYATTQLFLFREGRRANAEMTAIAKSMNNDDLQGYAAFIATLAPVPAPDPGEVDPDRMQRGQALSRQYKCSFCHGSDYSGGEQVPRIGGQHEAYLRMVLREFKDGKRQGYTMAMAGALSEISHEELDTVAYFLARFRD